MLAQELQPRSYTQRVLDATHRLHTVDAASGVYECDGYLLDASRNDLIACECQSFDPYFDCIHSAALGYVLDSGVNPPAGEGALIPLPLPIPFDAILLVRGGDALVG